MFKKTPPYAVYINCGLFHERTAETLYPGVPKIQILRKKNLQMKVKRYEFFHTTQGYAFF